jgi:hypothetical protein
MAKPVKVRRCRATVTRFDRCTLGEMSRSDIRRGARSPASISCCDHLAKGGPGFANLPFTALPESVSPATQHRDAQEQGPLGSAHPGHQQPASGLLPARFFRLSLPIAPLISRANACALLSGPWDAGIYVSCRIPTNRSQVKPSRSAGRSRVRFNAAFNLVRHMHKHSGNLSDCQIES